jgi:hypothetical protein
MNLASFTIKHLAKMISGDIEGWPYRSGPELVKLFNTYGFTEIYEQNFPTRYIFVEEKLKALNGKDTLKEVIKDLLDSRNWMNAYKTLKPVEECATQVNDLIRYDNYEVIRAEMFFKVRELSGSIIKLDIPFKKASSITEIAIEEQIYKCRDKIVSGDYDGAITNARSLVETLLTSIENELNPNAAEPDGDLVKSYNRVRVLLNLDPSRKDITDALKQVLSGLSSVVHGLATMHNKMSDAHATSYRPAKHHAKLAVNSAKTLADFLFEKMACQKAKGTFPSKTSRP